jgi:hypothetical protein
MLLALSASFAGENFEQSDCLTWNDTTQNVCPDIDQVQATPGERILSIGDEIKASGVRRQGGCWDFVKAVYDCATYSTKRIFPASGRCDKNGLYLEDVDIIQPGDWIMHINLEYRQSERIDHSAIFVHWIDKEEKKAYMLDYVGNNRCSQPGYKEHVLTDVYCVVRAIPSKEEAAR